MNMVSKQNMVQDFDQQWAFPVELYNLWAVPEVEGGVDVEVPPLMRKAVVRTDTAQVLGTVGNKYKIIKHDDVVNSIMDAVSQANISQDCTFNVKVIEDGAKLRGTILFNDLVIEPDVGDYVKFMVQFYNSYDGSWAFQQSAMGYRLWCKNGCADLDTIATTVSKHTAGVNVKGSAAKIEGGLDAFFKKREMWQEWMNIPVSKQQAEDFFKFALCKLKSNTSTERFNEKRLNELMGLWYEDSAKLGSNKWALYNAMTYWSSHTDQTRSPETVARDRERQVINAMSTAQWHQALVA